MIAAPSGSGVRPILKEPLTDFTSSDWSPDSRSLAVVHAVNGVPVLWIVDIEQAHDPHAGREAPETRATGSPGCQARVGAALRHPHRIRQFAAGPACSSNRKDTSVLTAVAPDVTGPVEYKNRSISAPDGRSLTYWRWRSVDKAEQIHQFDIATKVDRELRFDPSAYGERGLLHSPDGSQVLLGPNGRRWARKGMIAPADASHPGLLIGLFDKDTEEPAIGFSPDGKTVFVTLAGEAPQFFDAETGAPRSVPGQLGRMLRLATPGA